MVSIKTVLNEKLTRKVAEFMRLIMTSIASLQRKTIQSVQLYWTGTDHHDRAQSFKFCTSGASQGRRNRSICAAHVILLAVHSNRQTLTKTVFYHDCWKAIGTSFYKRFILSFICIDEYLTALYQINIHQYSYISPPIVHEGASVQELSGEIKTTETNQKCLLI